MIAVVEATSEDLSVTQQLWLDMVKEKRPDWSPRSDWWLVLAEELLRSGTYTQLVAIDSTAMEAAGFLDFLVFPEPSTGKIHMVGQHLYVRPEYRGSSAALRLIRAAKKKAGKQGASVVELFAFSDEVDQWTKVGFSPVRILMRSETHV